MERRGQSQGAEVAAQMRPPFGGGTERPAVGVPARHDMDVESPHQARHRFGDRHHGALQDGGVRGERPFDLGQFDPVARQLDLEVLAAPVLQGAVGQPSPEVAGAVPAPSAPGASSHSTGRNGVRSALPRYPGVT